MLTQKISLIPGRINKVVAIIHPYCGANRFSDPEKAVRGYAPQDSLWKGEIFKASREPGTAVLVVGSMGGVSTIVKGMQQILYMHARSKIGDRAFYETSGTIKGIRQDDALKMAIAPEARGIAFGEFTSSCVKDIAADLQGELGISFSVDRLLSADPPQMGDGFSVFKERGLRSTGHNEYSEIFARWGRYVPVDAFLKQNTILEERMG